MTIDEWKVFRVAGTSSEDEDLSFEWILSQSAVSFDRERDRPLDELRLADLFLLRLQSPQTPRHLCRSVLFASKYELESGSIQLFQHGWPLRCSKMR